MDGNGRRAENRGGLNDGQYQLAVQIKGVIKNKDHSIYLVQQISYMSLSDPNMSLWRCLH